MAQDRMNSDLNDRLLGLCRGLPTYTMNVTEIPALGFFFFRWLDAVLLEEGS